MRVPFPGCPDHIRAMLAYSSVDRAGWQDFLDYLKSRFSRLEVSLETLAGCGDNAEWMPSADALGTATNERAISHISAASARPKPRLQPFAFHYRDDLFDRGAEVCAFEMDCVADNGALKRIRLSFLRSLEPAYKRSLEVLLGHVEAELQGALLAQTSMSRMSGETRDRLERLWHHLPFAVALVSAKKRILAMNSNMEDLLGDRRLFRPGAARDHLHLRDFRDERNLVSAIDDVAHGLSMFRSLKVDREAGSQWLEVRPVDRNGSAEDDLIPPVIVTMRRGATKRRRSS